MCVDLGENNLYFLEDFYRCDNALGTNFFWPGELLKNYLLLRLFSVLKLLSFLTAISQ